MDWSIKKRKESEKPRPMLTKYADSGREENEMTEKKGASCRIPNTSSVIKEIEYYNPEGAFSRKHSFTTYL